MPENFLGLGYLAIIGGVYGIWRIGLVSILFIVIGVLIISIRDGVFIDTERKLMKEYISILFYRFGKWKDISNAEELNIYTTTETQAMSVLSISRNGINEVSKLILIMNDEEIELFSGYPEQVFEKGELISKNLNIKLVNNDNE